MILLLNETYQVIETFKTDAGLFLYFKEGFKALDEQTRQNWNFSRYSHKLLALLVKDTQGKPFVDMARQACQQESDLVIMCTGDKENPSFYHVTSDLDVDALQEKWCRLFCEANNLIILTR